MDASEGTVSPRRECLTSLSYVATRRLVLGIVFHIILSLNAHGHKSKADVSFIKEG